MYQVCKDGFWIRPHFQVLKFKLDYHFLLFNLRNILLIKDEQNVTNIFLSH